MTDTERKELTLICGNLRHLYENIVNGYLGNPKGLANGLLSPQIQKLEKLLNGPTGDGR
jgi:hypothetical protein